MINIKRFIISYKSRISISCVNRGCGFGGDINVISFYFPMALFYFLIIDMETEVKANLISTDFEWIALWEVSALTK